MPWPGRERCEHLLGPSFHPLPADFLPLPERREIRPNVARVLITLGGAGKAADFERVVASVRRALPEAAMDCVVGPFAEEPAGVKADRSVALIRSPRSLKPLMLGCDLAVAASGQTLFELAATGTPAVAVAAAANQRENLLGMERAGSVLAAGALGDADLERTLEKCLGLARDAATRRRLSEAGRKLVDGKGAERVAAELSRLLARRRGPR
jgi:spore coat polysaccharide biosynthesis predicted glycosyltransferase SpsG